MNAILLTLCCATGFMVLAENARVHNAIAILPFILFFGIGMILGINLISNGVICEDISQFEVETSLQNEDVRIGWLLFVVIFGGMLLHGEYEHAKHTEERK